MTHSSNGLLALADLLKPQNEESDEDEPVAGVAKLGPASIGLPSQNKPKQKQAKILDAEEVPEGAEYEDLNDPRIKPEYDMIFQQDVSSEDIFLQMGSKTPTSASCPFLKIKINLPDTKYAEVELDVTEKFLDCRSPKYKLGLHLPHPVDSKNGKAQWDSENGVLTVTLKMNREYDFLNG
ncbi:hypothetical protein BSL78_11154 [Apostichopus japonicus]|uniref:PIH1D1/2/3 CS-like domain-containing protein n=1 Tax=Stichopus japonicus TaxID=307972 RepID=A0A2G8KVA2_STIJA|nr:hypothetical protein BSL78_11154 [Apostichopus japonicus]